MATIDPAQSTIEDGDQRLTRAHAGRMMVRSTLPA
jgi:hypothetical protein